MKNPGFFMIVVLIVCSFLIFQSQLALVHAELPLAVGEILKKTGSPKKDFIGVIAELLTNFGNNCLQYKKIDLPYNDLN